MDKLTVRRKLLRGSLSAPVVLTVSSASAQTVTSFGQCIARNAGQQPSAFLVPASDAWYRVKNVIVYTISRNGTPLSGYYFIDGLFYRSTSSPGTIYLNNPLPLGYSATAAPEPWWQLVWFDSSGNQVTGGWQNPQNGLAATLSCQLSFG